VPERGRAGIRAGHHGAWAPRVGVISHWLDGVDRIQPERNRANAGHPAGRPMLPRTGMGIATWSPELHTT
jgi:hypothetical protein